MGWSRLMCRLSNKLPIPASRGEICSMNNEALSLAQSIGFPGTTWEQFREWAWEEHGVNISLSDNPFKGGLSYNSHYRARTHVAPSREEAEEYTAILLRYFLQNIKDSLCKSCGKAPEVLHEGYCEECFNNLIGMT